jgi:hypothetical protein
VAPPDPDPLDQLFSAPLAEFVKTRDRLAGELRKQGDKTRAAEVKALAKPTPAAWAVNQAVRASPESVKKLLQTSERMASLQLRAGSDPDSRRRFEEVAADHKGAIGQLVGNAGRALRDAGHAVTPTVLEKVENNLKWAALDPEQRPVLAGGRLYRDLAPQGFGAFGLGTADGDDEESTIDLSRPRERPPGPPPPRPRVVTFQAAEEEETPATDTRSLRAELREADKRVKDAERELQQRTAATRAAQAALSELERKAAVAREALEAADQERGRAQSELAAEEAKRAAASDALDRATRATIRPAAVGTTTRRTSGPEKRRP